MKLEDYVNNYLNIPYDVSKQMFLWAPNEIPVAKNGKIKDW